MMLPGATVYATVMGFAGNGVNAAHLYRSTDAGAHWTNISSNLPNAPANSVVVDPNDANTLYVALDTGVYVTTQVTTCASANCWSIYGTNLPNAPVVQLSAASAMPTGDGRTGVLRAATYGRGLWQIPLLTASAAAQPLISLSPGSLTFTTQPIASQSVPQTITVTNTGNAPLTVNSVATAGDFSESDTCTEAPIAVSQSCSIQVRFQPTAMGNRTGVLTVFGNVAGGQATAALSGVGSAGSAIVLNPLTLNFPSTTITSISPAQNITISNTSASSISLMTPSVSTGDFRIVANTCATSLGPGTGCTVSIAFTPTSSGVHSGNFSMMDDAGTQLASLNGTGTSPATDALSPLALTFTSQQITAASVAQQVTLTNSGDLPLTLIAAQIMSGDFTAVNACGNSLNPHSSCSINVSFVPKNIGPLTGTLTVSDQYRTQSVSLSGIGLAPAGVSLAPLSGIAFPATGLGVPVTPQTVTLTNNGGVPLLVQNIDIAGDFLIVPGSNTCGSRLEVAASCILQIAFVPSAGGRRSGTLTVTDNAGSSPQTLSLTGIGVDFTLNPNGGTRLTIANGQNAVYLLLISSAANITGTATFTCTGAPANSTCNVTPSTVALGNTTTISVTVLTGITSAAVPSPPRTIPPKLFWCLLLLPLSLVPLHRSRRFSLTAFIFLGCLLAVTGCGQGRAIPLGTGSNPTPGPVTPSGTYNIVASASSAGLTRTVTLTLIVQ